MQGRTGRVFYQYEGAYLTRVCESKTSTETACGPDATDYVSQVLYDDRGRDWKVLSPAGTLEYGYEPTTARLASISFRNAAQTSLLSLGYTYDPAGNIQAITDGAAPAGSPVSATAQYEYDVRSRLVRWSHAGIDRYFSYDTLGNLTGRDVASPAATNQTYADPQRPHALSSRSFGGQAKSYTYGADGNATFATTRRARLGTSAMTRRAGSRAWARAPARRRTRTACCSSTTTRAAAGLRRPRRDRSGSFSAICSSSMASQPRSTSTPSGGGSRPRR